MKKILAFALCVMMIMTASFAMADRLDDILAAGKIVVATSPDWPPYETIDNEGNIFGSDIAMCEWFAEQLGVELEIQPLNFDACLAGVATGSVDMVVAGLTYNPDRLGSMDMVGIYYNEGPQGLIVPAGMGATYNSADAFAGKIVAAQNGTTQQVMIEEQLPDCREETVTKIPDGVNMVKAGRIDALAVPGVVSDSIMKENEGVLEVSEFKFDFDGGNYIAIVKDQPAFMAKMQELVDQLNAENLYEGWMAAAIEQVAAVNE